MTQIAKLNDRALVRIAGEDALELLKGLVTCDVEQLQVGQMTFGALLTPQGKILFDFFILREKDGFLFELDGEARAGFIKRMMFYKLRAAVTIDAVEDGRSVYAVWKGKTDMAETYKDPRLGNLGYRCYAPELEENTSVENYHNHRIALGVPQSGEDFELGAAFPHEVLMDQFEISGAGVDFTKGCYVGQEVVSRMQHRGTARRRIIQIAGKTPLPKTGDIVAGGKSIGTLGSVSGKHGLANIRMDRAARALQEGNPNTLDDQVVELMIPEWTSLEWPQP